MGDEIKEVEVYGPDHKLITDSGIYDVKLYNPNEVFDDSTAYLEGEYFYVYRGEKTQHDLERSYGLRPGIYMNSDTHKPLLVKPETEHEKEFYLFEGKIKCLSPERIIESINNGESILATMPKAALHDLYQISTNDDILKRIAKMIFNAKGITVDDCDGGFPDKNAKFNFKQNINAPDKPLSWNYLVRAVNATKTKIKLVVEDIDPDHPVGTPIETPIEVSTEDTYEL